MSIPKNFAEVSLAGGLVSGRRPSSTDEADPWSSPEGIDILPVYGP